MQADDPPFLPVGTDVSAKYKGAFCEAKIKKVVKNIKCKVSFKAAGLGSTTVTDEAIKGTLRVGNTVEVRQDPKKDLQEAIITKIQDCSQYTVVFDDGDITTLRRSALCLKSGRHFAESETLDQLPLTHPEHFGNPVIGSSSRRGRRTNRSQSDDSDSEATDTITTSNVEREPHTGRVVLVQCGGGGGGGGGGGDKKRPQSSGAAQGWFPGLVVAPGAQDTVKIKVKEDYLVRSFKDGRYYTVPKKEAKEFKRTSANSEMGGLEAALQYLDKDVLPPHWDRDILFGQETHSDEMDSDDEPLVSLLKVGKLSRRNANHLELKTIPGRLNKIRGVNKYVAVAISVSENLKGMDKQQAVYAKALISNILRQGLLNRLDERTSLSSSKLVMQYSHCRRPNFPGEISDEVENPESSDDEPREEKDHFVAQLYKFMDDRGTPLNRQPTIANKDIDLYRLFNVVQKLGGYNRVSNQNQWKGIANRLGFQPPTTSVTNLCKQAYKKFLHSFEEFYRKLGVTLVAHPRGGRSTGRSLIRDRDKIQNQSSSPAHSLKDDEKPTEKPVTPKSKEKEPEKEKEIKVEKDIEVKEKETPKSVKEVEVKEKEVKGKESKVTEKEVRKEGKKESVKEAKLKSKRETKVKTEVVQSSEEEDSGDNQPLAPLSNKLEKSSSDATLSDKSSKVSETPVKKVYKNMASVEGTAGKRGLDRGEKGSVKKVMQRRGSNARAGTKETEKESRGKSASDTTPNKKQETTDTKVKEKETHLVISAKKSSSSDKNDSDSSSRGSKSGKTPLRRNITPSDTPPSTPGSSTGSQLHSTKKPRKRKIMEASDSTTSFISCDVGDKLKVYYGPAQSESKVTYEAKVIEVDGRGADTLLRVHYTGWNTRYDEWIKPSRIADNLTQKNKHKDKGRRNQNTGTGPPESLGGKKIRQASSAPSHASSLSKTRTRNRSSSNNTTASNQQTTDVQSDSDSECESDSSGQRGGKRLSDDKTIIKDRGTNDTSSPVDKVLEHEKEKILRMGRVSRSPQVKRMAESPGTLHSRVKRTRLKQEDRELPRGRDFDLNEIRSELKGFEKAVKLPLTDNIKIEPDAEPIKEDLPCIIIKQEKTPEKVTEDIYEFKEPEPFEFEARKSEEKKKRTTHRIFDDLPQIKLSPTRTTVKSPVVAEEEKSPPQQPAKSHYDTVFDKLCGSENFNVESTNTNSAGKESEALSIFSDLAEANEDSGDRLMISETEDSQGPLFTHQQDIFQEKSFLPIFKGFTPAKNQETYSKKDASHKLRDIDDDLTSSSALKGEQSSDEDPIGTAIKRVNEHSMSDDSNDSELLKTPATPVSTPSTSVVIPVETKTPVLDPKVKLSSVDPKSKPVVAEPKTKSPLLQIKTKAPILEVKTKSPLIDIKTKPAFLEVKTRSPLLDIKTKPTLLEVKTKSPLLDVRTKASLIDTKNKSPLIDIKTKTTVAETKTKSPLIDIKSKTNLDTKTKTPVEIKTLSQEKSVEKPTVAETKELKTEEKIAEKPAPGTSAVETLRSKQDTQSTNIVNKETLTESTKREGNSQEPKESSSITIAMDSDSQMDIKSESDGGGSFADIVIPDPPSFLIQKEGPSIADKVLRAINNNKRAATPTPKEAKVPKLDSSAKLTKIHTVSKTQMNKVLSVSEASKTPMVESSANSNQSLDFFKDSRDTAKVIPKTEITNCKDSNKELISNELFSKAESSLNIADSLSIKKETIERRKSGAEPASLGGKSNKVLSETIQKLSSQISQPTPPLPEFKDERSEDSDSSESDRRLIIDKLSEEESQSGISESTTSQPIKIEKSESIWNESDSQKDADNEKSVTADPLVVKDEMSSKVPEEDSNISLLLCEETIPGSPAPENLVDGVKTTSKQKTRILEIPFASAPSISPDQAKDPLSLKDISRDNSRDGMGSSRSDRDRERDTECLGASGGNTVDTVMDNTPPITPDSSLDNMSPSREQMLSDGDNPSEANKPPEEENRISAISKKMNEVEKSNSGSNLRSSAPGSPVVGVVRRGRRPRSMRASEGEDHHQTISNISSTVGAHSSPQYNAPHPRPMRYNFYVELDDSMDSQARISLLTSRLADVRKAYHSLKAELATIDRRRKKLRRKEREAVKAAKAACAT